MKKLLTILVSWCLLSSGLSAEEHSALARITFWYPGDCPYGFKSATGVPLKPWRHCAVDPDKVPYFSKVRIPELGLDLLSTDTGTAVRKRTAAREDGKTLAERKAIVIDIPVRSAREYSIWEAKPAIYTQVYWSNSNVVISK